MLHLKLSPFFAFFCSLDIIVRGYIQTLCLKWSDFFGWPSTLLGFGLLSVATGKVLFYDRVSCQNEALTGLYKAVQS